MAEANDAVVESIDELPDEQIDLMLSDFLRERGLVGEFLVWIDKWKTIHKVTK